MPLGLREREKVWTPAVKLPRMPIVATAAGFTQASTVKPLAPLPIVGKVVGIVMYWLALLLKVTAVSASEERAPVVPRVGGPT